MITIDPKTNTERDNYKLLIGSIIPRPIAFVTTMNDSQIVNAAPFSYFNIVTANPPMISLSVQRKENDILKDTTRNILANQEFVVHMVDEDNVEEVNKTAANLPSDESELDHTNFTQVKSTKVAVPGIKEAKVRMECVLEQVIPLGGMDNNGTDLIIGRVVAFHIDDNIYYDGKIDPEKLAPTSRLAGQSYATLGTIFEHIRPK